MMGQGLAPFEAAKTAVFIHALSAEAYCRKHDQVGLVASDIIKYIPAVVKRLRKTS
jgi:NAD(P)H-hydrate repair Nnr-like enzyme with NAD(P)H-hydrate dehydratase domain